MTNPKNPLPEFRVLGVRVHAVHMQLATDEMERQIQTKRPGYFVAVTGMHGISETKRHPDFRNILNEAALVVPDGMPLLWLARCHNFPLRRRVCGAELMESFCRQTGSRYRHFFYGGNDGVADDLACKLAGKFGIVVAGTYTPPFRPLTAAEEQDVVARVADAKADILWVGLSTPKQERWMFEYRRKLGVPLLVGVGAAFDMNSGRLKRAPVWMQQCGLEWFFRLLSEPRRLWKRYLVTIPEAAWSVSLELLRLRKFE
jgi:N-acetylglucosaminyldiphosphoundecaprenol N-acetyl-beta-D-mannosaminyltransferase